MIESIQGLLDEHADLQKQLADPAVHADQGKARKLGRRYSELNGIVEAYNRVNTLRDDVEAAREMAAEDPDFADEVKELEAQLPEAEEKLRRLLMMPRLSMLNWIYRLKPARKRLLSLLRHLPLRHCLKQKHQHKQKKLLWQTMPRLHRRWTWWKKRVLLSVKTRQ